MTLGGGGGLCQRGCKQSLNVLKVEVKVFFGCFGYIYIKIMLYINRDKASEENFEKNERFEHKKGPRPLGGARAGCASPPPWIR